MAWAGHLLHMNNDRTLKTILNTKPDGVRRVGRPKLQWENGIDQDMRILEVKNWKKVSLDKDEWANLLNTLPSGDDFSRFFCYMRQCPVATFVVFSRVVS